jgi:gluconolactonase
MGLMRYALTLLIAVSGLPAQDFSEVTVTRVAAGYIFTEGPVWSRDGFLLFSDIPSNRILKFTPGPGTEVFRENSGGANGSVFDEKSRLVTCEEGNRRVTRTAPGGQVEVLADKFDGKRFNGPNDLAIRRDGHIYFTDPAFGKNVETRDMDYYGVYHLTPKGELSVFSRSDKRPNGIALSPNGKLLYLTNSDERTVHVFDLDRQGNPSGDRVLISGIQGVPDGIKADDKGNLFIACAGVAIYTAAGKFIRMIELVDTPSNLAFGDGDMQSLYVTARGSVYRIRLDAKGAAQRE